MKKPLSLLLAGTLLLSGCSSTQTPETEQVTETQETTVAETTEQTTTAETEQTTEAPAEEGLKDA